ASCLVLRAELLAGYTDETARDDVVVSNFSHSGVSPVTPVTAQVSATIGHFRSGGVSRVAGAAGAGRSGAAGGCPVAWAANHAGIGPPTAPARPKHPEAEDPKSRAAADPMRAGARVVWSVAWAVVWSVAWAGMRSAVGTPAPAAESWSGIARRPVRARTPAKPPAGSRPRAGRGSAHPPACSPR